MEWTVLLNRLYSAGEIIQSVKCFYLMCTGSDFELQNLCKMSGVVMVHSCNPGAGKAETRGSPSFTGFPV